MSEASEAATTILFTILVLILWMLNHQSGTTTTGATPTHAFQMRKENPSHHQWAHVEDYARRLENKSAQTERYFQ